MIALLAAAFFSSPSLAQVTQPAPRTVVPGGSTPRTVVPGGMLRPAANQAPLRGALIQIGLGTFQPTGAWAKTYAGGGTLHLEPGFKTSKDWLWSLQVRSVYGMRVKIDSSLLGFLTTEDNQILGLSGSYAEVRTEGRGTQIGGQVGRIVPVLGSKPGSGLDLRLGGGWMQHRIHFFNPSGGVPMVYTPYRYGLDRLHRGTYGIQSVGYVHQARSGEFGWSVALEFQQAYMLPQRGFNYDTRLPDTQAKWDYQVGIRALWNLNILRAATPSEGPRFYVD